MPHSQPIVITGVCYFASDFHFGAPNAAISSKREQTVIHWLDIIQKDANHLFLLGDIFDFWFEFSGKPPDFYESFLNKIAELRKKDIEIYFFTGNHDMWVKNYLIEYLGIHIFKKKQEFIINNKKFLLGHGDGLGRGELGYKCLKAFLNCKINIWLFGLLPQKTGFAIAQFCSRKSRAMTPEYKEQFMGNEKELLVQFCFQYLKNHDIDYFIFGHRHLPLEIAVNKAVYFNTGDWLNYNTYIKYENTPLLCCFD
ncbi:MAG: UDP-2,3-diacylglucosamine diphosphatase [Bacteroidetes bacterium]|nr:UDP-2,3-diacylglucosamine diphosphatase [Bacteroidota bacterium]MCL1968431.1 UDP-2,3-diacylglucosamine diphosphatase [Bacteroidota bacterium]